jgi:hypothetical protein
MGASSESWRLRGTVLIACNCDYGCPCNFNARPTKGFCEGGWTWHVEQGVYGGTDLDGTTFSVYVKWPGAIHEGGGKALALVDERAEQAQRESVATLIGGNVGGPWGILGWTWDLVEELRPVRYELSLREHRSSLKAGDVLDLEFEPITDPVTGAEAHPGAVLPEGLTIKEGAFASSKRFRLANGFSYDHSGQYAAFGPFDYGGP